MITILLEKIKALLSELKTNIENLPDRVISFSSDEKIVGTWIDGSPLYSKTFVNNNLIYDVIDSYRVYRVANDNTTNADIVLWVNGCAYDDNDDRWYSLPYNRIYRTNQYIEPEVYSDNGNIVATFTITNRSPLFEITKANITVYYTKRQIDENTED